MDEKLAENAARLGEIFRERMRQVQAKAPRSGGAGARQGPAECRGHRARRRRPHRLGRVRDA